MIGGALFELPAFAVDAPDARPVQVAVFDLGGRLRLNTSPSGAGRYPFRLDGPGWVPGIDLPRVEHAGWRKTTRVALLR